ncbi:M23 family metallopeptidase [candidate division WOR-3 bacterium]|nr:M23 family metallopeptidase [candidate division WOR-3 bacterium]
MKMKKWTIIFNYNRVRGISVTEKVLIISIAFLGIFGGVFGYVVFEGCRNKTLINKYIELKNENNYYLSNLKRISSDIVTIDSQMEKAGVNNTVLMLAGELEPIDKTVKAMGVGGFPEKREFYSDAIESMSNKLESRLNRIENLVNLENRFLKQAEGKLEKLNSRLSHTPAIWPTYGWVTDGFGWRIHPITKKRQFHEGFDIANRSGTSVIATADGRVTSAKWRPGYGKTIVIRHGYGFETRYAHLRDYCVRKGQYVRRGQRIGFIGSTGRVTGSHLHYEVRVIGQPVNPYNYLDTYKNCY